MVLTMVSDVHDDVVGMQNDCLKESDGARETYRNALHARDPGLLQVYTRHARDLAASAFSSCHMSANSFLVYGMIHTVVISSRAEKVLYQSLCLGLCGHCRGIVHLHRVHGRGDLNVHFGGMSRSWHSALVLRRAVRRQRLWRAINMSVTQMMRATIYHTCSCCNSAFFASRSSRGTPMGLS
jgi:hypothetical protein